MKAEQRVHAVILAGGSGTRFWPASRRGRPKQLLPLAGERSLLCQTVDRAVKLCGDLHRVLIATGEHLVPATLADVPGLTRANLLVEPVARNTAPCIGWAAASVARRDPDAVIMVLPSDPHIADEAGFARVARQAIARAREGVITTIGIRPTRAETGYGYIEVLPASSAREPSGPILDVKRFVEKPDQARAEAFLRAGNFYWNAGMFFFRARDMSAAIAEHMPDLAHGLRELDEAARQGREADALPRVFPRLPNISIDHGIMEQVGRMSMVPGEFGWSDLGGWVALSELSPRDAHGNSAPPGTVLLDASGNHVDDRRTGQGKRVIALVGVENLVVVETDDALLVVSRDAAQRVKEVVDALKARGDDDLT